MGEYAKYNGEQVKIGTCENMYYLRADQRGLVVPELGSVDPSGPEAIHLRFRFPWPHEDGTEPGAFEDYSKAVGVPGATPPAGAEHSTVQFVAQAGYLASLPCPEGPGPHAVAVHRNGFAGAVQLTQQKLLADGRLVPVCRCGGCGAAWRLEDPHEIEALAVAFRSEGDRRERDGRLNGGGGEHARKWWDQVADRILAGAQIAPPVAVLL